MTYVDWKIKTRRLAACSALPISRPNGTHTGMLESDAASQPIGAAEFLRAVGFE